MSSAFETERRLPVLDPAEATLLRLAVDLGACDVGGPLSAAEKTLVLQATQTAPATAPSLLAAARAALEAGADPLGDQYCLLRPPDVRRRNGAVYTPSELVVPMVDWVIEQAPTRVVDAGAGSGRFILEVARRGGGVQLVAVDLDPVATLMSRAAFAALDRPDVEILNADFTRVTPPKIDGMTAFIGNPPYVRHHALPAAAKAWAQQAARHLGHRVSGLAGLHAYFFLATARHVCPGDIGCYVTSAEWLDVNYGAIVRDLLLGTLGGESIHVLAPESLPFDKTATTAAITCFRVNSTPDSMRFRPVSTLGEIAPLASAGEPVARPRLAETTRWSTFVRTRNTIPEGFIELGELCRVHRGTVTGSNRTWVTLPGASDLPDSVLFPSVTRARELFAAGAELASTEQLKLVIDLPTDLDELGPADRKKVNKFLNQARHAGIKDGYIASHRAAWWSVRLRAPAPILATYMARRPPAFVRNLVGARHINIAHGLYPRETLPTQALTRLAEALRTSISLAQGRTYAGGLTKFEPREMERLPVPTLESLLAT